MNKRFDLVKFNLTDKMASELIKFNSLKKELTKLQKLYNLDKHEKLLLQIKEIEGKMDISRNIFIQEFRINNKDEIIKYLEIKDQK